MKCCMCGRPTDPRASVILEDRPDLVFCATCYPNVDRCGTCIHNYCPVYNAIRGGECPVAAVIQVTRQEGFMVVTESRINPQLVDIYCEDCICRKDRRCAHFTDYTCEKYEMKEFQA